jgi:hypothetical protein
MAFLDMLLQKVRASTFVFVTIYAQTDFVYLPLMSPEALELCILLATIIAEVSTSVP